MDKLVSIVIPTFNSALTIDQCLESIYANVDAPPFEVTVADGGSTDNTIEIARKYPVKINKPEGSKRVSKAESRNTAVAQSSGNIIAFTDSDTRVAKDWISTLVKHFDDPSIAGVGGPSISPDEDTFWAKCYGVLMESFLGSAGARNTAIYKHVREVNHNPPVNSAVRRNIFHKAGGFAVGFIGEDIMLDARIKRLGGKLIYDPKMIVWHYRRRTLGEFVKQLLGYGRGRASVFLRYPESLPFTYFCVAIFFLGMIFTIPLYILADFLRPVIVYGWLAYFLFILLSSIYIAIRKRRFILAAILPPLAIIEHLVLGVGFVIGLINPDKERGNSVSTLTTP